MNKSLALVLGLLYLVLMVDCAQTASGAPIKAFYVPFGAETFMPVTRENIEHKALCVVEIDVSSTAADRVRSLIKRDKTGTFNDNRVRLKLSGALDEDLFIDSAGNAFLGRSQTEYGLSEGNFKKLGVLLEQLVKSLGCHAY